MARDPFAIHPSPDNYFESVSHGKVERLLIESVKEGEPNILITGEYGVGKTLLCLKLFRYLETQPDIPTVTVTSPAAPYDLLLSSIAAKLEVTGFTNSCKTVGQLEAVLFNLYSAGRLRKPVCIVIDDLQDFEQQVLLRCLYLTNFHVKDFFPFRLICFSHPRFIEELEKNSKLVPFLQRFRRRLDIQPLQQEELKEYIYFRLLQAGARGRPVFNDESLRAIAEVSGSIPRLINNLCDRVLLRAVELRVDRIDAKMVRDVCGRNVSEEIPPVQEQRQKNGFDVNLDAIAINNGNDPADEVPPAVSITRRQLKMSGLVVGAVIILIGFAVLRDRSPDFSTPSLPGGVRAGKIDHQAQSPNRGDGGGSAAFGAAATTPEQQAQRENQVQAFSSAEENMDQRIKIRQMTTDDSYETTTESPVAVGEAPYTLEVYSSSTPAEVDAELKRLGDLGLAPLFVAEAGSDRVISRWSICLGNFASPEDARQSTWFGKVPEAKVRFLPYTLLLSLVGKAEDADRLRKIMEVDGYKPWLERLDNGQCRLLMGAYPTRKDADLRARELQQEGITAIVVKK